MIALPSALPAVNVNLKLYNLNLSKHLVFKHLLLDSYRQESMQHKLEALATSESTVAAMYPCLSKLACIALVLPISTAESEDAFQ